MSQFFASGGQVLEFQLQHQSLQWIFSRLGLISFWVDWLDLLVIQGTLKSLLQHHSSKASILRHSTFFILQLSHLYVTTGKITALFIWTFVSKVMSLLFKTLSSFVSFPSKYQCLLMSMLQSLSTVIFELKKINSAVLCTSPLLFAMK